LRKSLTACEALAALPPTPHEKQPPAPLAQLPQHAHHALDHRRIEAGKDL